MTADLNTSLELIAVATLQLQHEALYLVRAPMQAKRSSNRASLPLLPLIISQENKLELEMLHGRHNCKMYTTCTRRSAEASHMALELTQKQLPAPVLVTEALRKGMKL